MWVLHTRERKGGGQGGREGETEERRKTKQRGAQSMLFSLQKKSPNKCRRIDSMRKRSLRAGCGKDHQWMLKPPGE